MGHKPNAFFLSLSIAIVFAALFPFAYRADAKSVSNYEKWRLLMFSTSLHDFNDLANDEQHRPSSFDWSTDYCSAPGVGNSGLTFDFTVPCRRHDFGYRNIKAMPGKWNSSSRNEIDQQFHNDLRYTCSRRTFWQRPTCYAWSEIFFRFVRLFAGP